MIWGRSLQTADLVFLRRSAARHGYAPIPAEASIEAECTRRFQSRLPNQFDLAPRRSRRREVRRPNSWLKLLLDHATWRKRAAAVTGRRAESPSGGFIKDCIAFAT